MNQELDFHKDSSYKTIHFYLTQVPVLLALEIVSGLMYMQFSDKFIISFYCLPVIAVYYFILFKCGWGGDWRQVSRRFFFTMIGFFIFVPIFFSIYFLVWNPTLSIQWFKSSSCRPAGQSITLLGNLERYGLQYVFINTDVVGLSCISNRKTNGNSMKSYDFYHKGDYYTCDNNYQLERSQPNNYTQANDTNSRQLAQNRDQDYNDSFNDGIRFLQTNSSNYSVNQNIYNNSNQEQTRKGGLSKRCRTQYTFSQVKIPSWLCQTVEDNNKMINQLSYEVLYEQPCYYAYYGTKEKARENGRDTSKDLREQNNFVIVRLDSEVFYYEEGFICLILLAMYPAILFTFQAPFSYVVYLGMLSFYRDSIKDENDEICGKNSVQEMAISKKVDEIGSTSQTERKRQQLEPNQIVQVLSPNSQLKDRDFYDIYNGTRRKQELQSGINPTIIVNTEEPINITKFNGDTTKSIMINKDRSKKYQAQSIDDLEDQQGQILNGPRNVTNKSNEYSSSSEEEANDQDTSYIKIRNIYKKKLNPTYQKEVKKKIKEGIKIENEEVKVIQEIKQKQAEFHQKQQEKRKQKKDTQKDSNQNESPTLDAQNDYSNILEISSIQPQIINQNQQQNNEQSNPVEQNGNNVFNLESKKDSESLDHQNKENLEDKPIQFEESNDTESQQIDKLNQAYELYAEQLNKIEKTVSSPPQETQLIQ